MKTGAIRRFFLSHIGLLEAASLLLALVANFLLQLNSYYGINYHSDDVGQQVLLHDWTRFGLHGTWLGPDPFLFKMLFHWPAEWLFGHGRKSIFFAAYLLSALFVIGAFFGLRYFAKKAKPSLRHHLVFLTVFPWAAGLFSFAAMLAFKNANLRSVELGIGLLLLATAAAWLGGKRSWRSRWPILASLLGGFLIFNDSAMLFFVWLPLAVFLAYSHWFEKGSYKTERLVSLAKLLAICLLFYEAFKQLFSLAGLHFYNSATTVVAPSQWGHFIHAGFINFLALFDAYISRNSFSGWSAVVEVLNLALVIAAIATSLYLLVKGRLWQRFFAVQPFFLFALYVFSGSATDVSTARYLILVPFYFALILFFAARRLRLGYLVAILALAALIGNLGSYGYWINKARHSYNPAAYTHNEKELSVAEIVKREGLTKGYATYGEANLIGYFSGYQATVTPIYCGYDKIQPYWVLMTEGQLKQKVDRSFIVALESSSAYLVLNKYPPLNLPANVDYSCPYQKIVAQFGPAAQTIQIAPDMKLLIYNHDLNINLARPAKTNPIN